MYLDMGKIIKFFYDLETTGLTVQHGIHELSGCIEVDGEVVKEFDMRIKPFKGCKWSPEALVTCGKTREQIEAYTMTERQAYDKVKLMLTPYIDRFDKTQKAFLVGYNNAGFDDDHFRAMFLRQDDLYFGSWFWADPLDVRVLAAQYLQDRRASMVNFKLATVAEELGIYVDDSRLHEAGYDIHLTRAIYRIVTGLDFEL